MMLLKLFADICQQFFSVEDVSDINSITTIWDEGQMMHHLLHQIHLLLSGWHSTFRASKVFHPATWNHPPLVTHISHQDVTVIRAV